MTKQDCRSAILSFKVTVTNYQRAVLNNDNHLPYDARARLVATLRSQLNQQHGKLQKYIYVITGGPGSAYLTAFSDAPAQNVVSATSSVIDNLDWIIGRLDSMDEKEYRSLFKEKREAGLHAKYWSALFSSVWSWILKHLTEVVVGVAVIALAAWFGLGA